jgi:hypothetical protein
LFDDSPSTDEAALKAAKQRGRELAQNALRDAGLPYCIQS